jgi:hypothetical protein
LGPLDAAAHLKLGGENWFHLMGKRDSVPWFYMNMKIAIMKGYEVFKIASV